MCENEGAGLYPYPHSFHLFFPPDPGGCRGYADVAQKVEHHARRYALVQAQPSAPWRGAPGQCETVVVMAHMEMTMLAENCTVGGKRLSVMVLHM